jgi:putative heme-binding domain-containing protein
MDLFRFRSAGIQAFLTGVFGWCMTFATVCCHAQDRTAVMLEALQRLKDQDLEANPALKKAVLNVLEKVRGTAPFVDIVRDFKLTNECPALLEFALKNPRDPNVGEALKTLLAQRGTELLKAPLADDSQAALLIAPLGDTGDNRIAELLLPLVSNPSRKLDVRREAVRSLARVHEGANGLLGLAKAGTLPADVKWVASTELNAVRWTAIKAAAAEVLPLPAARGNAQLPPIAELVRMKGDPVKGAAVFRRPDVNCISCHQVKGEGTDFGPNLSEIGTKLGREALCEAILDPSAGISFGFEAWQLTLKNGDEAFGLIASETEQEVVVKLQGGTLNRIKKAEIESRSKQPTSVMPVGLQSSLSTAEFVDLIEYLAALKKAN